MEQKKVLRGPFKNEFENPFYFAFRIALIERERERNRRDRIERKKRIEWECDRKCKEVVAVKLYYKTSTFY